MLVIMLALLVVQASASILPALRLLSIEVFQPELDPGRTRFYRLTRDFSPPEMPDPFAQFHAKLETAGNERIAFWWSLILLLIVDAGVIYLVNDMYPTTRSTICT